MKTNAKIKTVVVGVDFSDCSKAAVKQARVIAKNIKANVVYAHVLQDPLLEDGGHRAFEKKVKHDFQKKVTQFYRLQEQDSVVVKIGMPHRELIKIAKKFPNPMIVVGHRGHSNVLDRFFLGSVAERLALHSPYPVFVHKGTKIIRPNKVLIPCDFTSRTDSAIKGTQKIGFQKPKLELYHVQQYPVPALDYEVWNLLNEELEKINLWKLAKFRKKYAPIEIQSTKGNDVGGKIEDRAKAFDMIAISPREHKGVFGSFGSVTSKVVRAGDTSVLVLP